MRDPDVVPVECARLKPRLGPARPHPLSPSPPCGEGGRSARRRLGGRAEPRVHSRTSRISTVTHATMSCALVAAIMLLLVSVAAAQEASPYVPLQHWTMPYVEHLIARGVILDPTPLTRPLKRADVVRVLRGVDILTAGDKVAKTVRRLLAALDVPGRGPRHRVAGDVGVAAATYARRDPLAAIDSIGPRQAGPGRGTASGGLDIQFLLGRVVAVTHPYFDTRLKYDADWYGYKKRFLAGRTAESYLSVQWPVGEVLF